MYISKHTVGLSITNTDISILTAYYSNTNTFIHRSIHTNPYTQLHSRVVSQR